MSLALPWNASSVPKELFRYSFEVLLGVAALVLASWATVDAVMRKREARAAMGWVGLAWLSPFVGSLLYFLLGINRVSRKAAQLGYGTQWQRAADFPLDDEERSAIAELGAAHPSVADLARALGHLTGRTVYPGNRVTPLVDGDEAYPAMLAAIAEARSTVSLCSYIFDFDDVGRQFCDELVAAQARGVQVRVIIDSVGARYGHPNAIRQLRARGLDVSEFLPSTLGRGRYANMRNHRKILVVDGRVGFTGGTNIRQAHCVARGPESPARCLHFRFDGPVVRHLQEVFAVDWAFCRDERLPTEGHFPTLSREGVTWARGIASGPDEDLDKLAMALFCAVNAARESVYVVTPYFLPDNPLVQALVAAVLRGVDVRVVVPERSNVRAIEWATMASLPYLLASGVQVSLSPAPFDHTKLAVVDSLWSLVGSTNWDPRSLRLNFELNVECYDPRLGRQLASVAAERFASGRRWTLEDAEALAKWVKVRNGIARLASPYL